MTSAFQGSLPGVTLSAGQVITGAGSRVLLSGGDLMAYDWIGGLRGAIDPAGQAGGDWSVSKAYSKGDRVLYGGYIYSARQDNAGESPVEGPYWSRVRESYAVIPGFNPLAQPFAPFGDLTKTAGDPGYVSRSLAVGDRITLAGGGGLAGGIYTLLPSRYAFLPGAYLITPTGLMQDLAPDSLQRPDGSAMVAGTRSSWLDGKGKIFLPFSRWPLRHSSPAVPNIRFPLLRPFFREPRTRRRSRMPPA